MAATGLIYDIQGYSVHDGPGIRTTVFLKGCPLSCLWCHSPESQSFSAQVCIKKTSCMGLEDCGHCLEACPEEGALETTAGSLDSPAKQTPILHHGSCTDCAACVDACPPKAFYVCGRTWTADEVLARVERDRPFYESSGGGVTLSGGEPLCQADFAEEFLRTCHQANLHTALDTTGYAPREVLRRVMPHVDLFLYDLKHMDSAAHSRACGVPNEPILENAHFLAKAGAKLQIRVPLIPLFNDSAENLAATASFCRKLGDAISLVQLLPYHTLGVSKYERLGYDGKVFAAKPMDDKRAEELAEIFREQGLPVVVH